MYLLCSQFQSRWQLKLNHIPIHGINHWSTRKNLNKSSFPTMSFHMRLLIYFDRFNLPFQMICVDSSIYIWEKVGTVSNYALHTHFLQEEVRVFSLEPHVESCITLVQRRKNSVINCRKTNTLPACSRYHIRVFNPRMIFSLCLSVSNSTFTYATHISVTRVTPHEQCSVELRLWAFHCKRSP